MRQHLRVANHSNYFTRIAIMTDTHCIAVSFDPEVHAADNRRLKVGYASRYPDYSRIPVKHVRFRGNCGESVEGVSVWLSL